MQKMQTIYARSQHLINVQSQVQTVDLEFTQDTPTMELLSTLQHIIVLWYPGAP